MYFGHQGTFFCEHVDISVTQRAVMLESRGVLLAHTKYLFVAGVWVGSHLDARAGSGDCDAYQPSS